ncbi:protein MAK16 homolog [Eucalyptus grandis]|uniref:protein MAK16 homolog n=1 Tax=Eucalyptus grandis TaxID=71139 RepID=UPI00192EF876|nr:protein MAK16 homolog [Eucalyptus grandis]
MQSTLLSLMFGLVFWGISSVSALCFNVPVFPKREKIMTTPRKEKKRQARSEEKAEKAAVLEKSIEKKLLERLRKGVHGDIYNYPVKKNEKEPEIEYVEDYDELEEELEDDIEDFGGLAINRVRAIGDNGEDEKFQEDLSWIQVVELIILLVQMKAVTKMKMMMQKLIGRGEEESSLALRKFKKVDAGSKPKKSAKVLVELRAAF